MCAIAGFLDLPWNEKVTKAMLETMRRRGPDARGIACFDRCTLLHARLAVMDPERGAQPMNFAFGNEEYTIVYNGELYNTTELRQELETLGHRFETTSDTEVLLQAYARWGEAAVQKLNGIFAFAVWEHRAQRLFLARDRMGVKPLFFMHYAGGLLFASEIKTILCYPDVRAVLKPEGAAQLILLGPGRIPGSGVLDGILELEPGHCMTVWQGKTQIRTYWRLQDREHSETFEETAEHVGFLVRDAIMRQTVSDVPLGTFLSGGLDSGLITALCAQGMSERGCKLRTFSVDYAHNDRYFVPNAFQPESDGAYIRLMEQAFQTEHIWCILTAQQLMDAMEEAVLARDLPGMADVDISLLLFCKQIKQSVTVALSGECADEIFGGYPWYRDPEIRQQEGFPWAQNTARRIQMLSPALRTRIDGEDFVRQQWEKTCRESDILPGTAPQERRMKELVNLNMRWFMQTLLDRKDRMSMYSGLEVRVPFCDHRIAEYLYGVPWEMKDYQGKEKGLLRVAMEGILPEKVLWRKKSPYPKTFDPAYLDMVSLRLRQILTEEENPLFALVDRSVVQEVLNGELPQPWYGQLMRRPQLICWLLQMEFWAKHYLQDMLW